ncbi:MAG TPA: Flp pilus assembly protein CpaB [Candidatus Limnocylindrales bacterium]|nr:Flp pilus assembly protein CpaB [Candidatus Limnocylindrales bacterium]
MRRYRPFLLLGLAAIIAFSTSSIAYRWLRSQSQVQPAQVEDTTVKTDVAVANFDIPRGSTLTLEMLRPAKLEADMLPNGAFKAEEMSALVGRVAIVDVSKNEAILQTKLAALDATHGVAALVDPSKRAMSVKVDDEVGVAGFVKPNDHVDLFVTVDTTDDGENQTKGITKLVLADTLVLAIGTELVRTGKDEVAMPVQVITLEVTPAEAEKLAFAATRGKFRLALRSPLTKEEALTPGATIETLLSSYQGGETGKKRGSTLNVGVQLIRGKEVTVVPF